MTNMSAAAPNAATPAEEMAALVATLHQLSADAQHLSNRCIHVANTLPLVVSAQVKEAVTIAVDEILNGVSALSSTEPDSSDSDSEFGDAHSTTSRPDSPASDASVEDTLPASTGAPGGGEVHPTLAWRRGIAPTPDELENQNPPGPDSLQDWYVVCVGRIPGIYSSPQMAEAQVCGVPRNSRKRKDSKQEALTYYRQMYGLGQVFSLNEVLLEPEN